MSKAQSVLEVATKLTIIGVPAFYLMGWAYLESYWAEFGISETLLGLSAADYVRAGAMMFVRHVVEGSSWIAILAWASLVLLIVVMLLTAFAMPTLFAAARWFRSLVLSFRREGRVDPKHRRLARSVVSGVDAARTWLMNALLIFLLVLCLIYLGIQPSKERAKEYAQKEIATFATFATTERNWVLGYTENEDVRPALVMQCGSEMCVLITSEKLEVIPRSAITRMETCRRVGRADDGTFHCITRTALLPTRAASGPASP
ncbi:hypothetical protein C0063_07875 [Pseudoxanthomonas sp. KAs_5_3]|nr:hypothetical protein C0063_07875 [Pseudoxanthomonas sp. KAs_5_3]